jgi:hypothetical protein
MLTYADVCGAGARLVELYLDDACIFAGEIACAPGNLIDAESQAEILLFSQVARTLSALFFFDVSLFWHGNLTLLAFFFNFLPFFFFGEILLLCVAQDERTLSALAQSLDEQRLETQV